MNKTLKLDDNNPSPFVQPFLVLHFKGDPSATEWMIDVGGQIDRYIKDWTAVHAAKHALCMERKVDFPMVFDWQSQATPLLNEMMDRFAQNNREVNRVYAYQGSGGPTHMLRNGAIFERIDLYRERSSERVGFDQWPDIALYLPRILEEMAQVS